MTYWMCNFCSRDLDDQEDPGYWMCSICEERLQPVLDLSSPPLRTWGQTAFDANEPVLKYVADLMQRRAPPSSPAASVPRYKYEAMADRVLAALPGRLQHV